VKTPIDAFVLDRLKKAGLKPAPVADRATLIRRVTYDLHGPAADARGDRLVRERSPRPMPGSGWWTRLLASPRYGEQWGRLLAGRGALFAESDGYEYDTHRPDAYRYPAITWCRASMTTKPYSQFVKEQLAGDEIDGRNENLSDIASGFKIAWARCVRTRAIRM